MQVFILTTLYLISILFHLFAFIICLAFVIPLQIKEAKIKNGLKMLRVQMLGSGLTIIFLSLMSMIALIIPIIFAEQPLYSNLTRPIEMYQYISIIVVFLHATGFLILSLIKRAMYRQQYSDYQKAIHKKVNDIIQDEK